jgi:hypothetical protein
MVRLGFYFFMAGFLKPIKLHECIQESGQERQALFQFQLRVAFARIANMLAFVR